ncbi:MAG TPA: hypothetical protein DCG12_19985 [Planctomycetaceae bacterium]|nr:hypothetical protein [Planctomycetaceae bacterium]
MFTIIRECIGWLLVCLALYLIWMGIEHIAIRRTIEGGIFLFSSLSLVKAGLLLVRMSAAARLCEKEFKSRDA